MLVVALATLAISGVAPRERFTWFLEIVPAVIALPILVATYRRFPLTDLLYVLIAIHVAILALGGHYTYAEVPLGFWVKDALHLARNHYDRVGHFAQGFVPALVAREIVTRKQVMKSSRGVAVFVLSFCLAVSALYELFEWWTAVFTSDGATAFLGTQGDPWDTQWDMFMCLVGASTALITLSGFHDRQMKKLAGS